MRNAALVLGIIAGIFGMLVGFAGYGYTTAVEHFGDLGGLAKQVEDVTLIRVFGVLAPLLAIVGGAMARSRALWGGIALLASAGGMYYAFGFGLFTVFPICFAGVAGLLAVAARRPDEETSHF